MPVGSRQREKRTRGMVDADERRVGHQIVSLDAAIVGMGAPGNIRQQTCRVAQAPILIVLLEMGRVDQAACPGIELFAMLGRPRSQLVEFARRQDERILRLLLGSEPRVNQPLANAKAETTISFGLDCRMISSSTTAP